MSTRAEIARSASSLLASAREMPKAVVGFDGFVDSIIDVVDQRRDMTPRGYTRIPTIARFAQRCAEAAGKSTNLELVVNEERFGGNGPLLAGGLASAGAGVTYIGAVGRADEPTRLAPIYQPFADLCERVIPLAPPSKTDALEFEDGKLMLGQPANVQGVTWARLVEIVGEDRLVDLVASSAILGIVNWTMMAGVEGIWRGLIERVLARSTRPGARKLVFIDLADPAKRTDADIRRALGLLAEMDALVPVTLGLNLAEAERLAKVLGVSDLRAAASERGEMAGAEVERLAIGIRTAARLACVVIHPRGGAAAARRALAGAPEGAKVESAWFDGPMVRRPKLSTGAGDHFNAGFALGEALSMPLAESLALGCACSGAYVRDARSPSRARLVEFLAALPEPEV